MRTIRPTTPDPDHATHDDGLVASLVARPLDLDPSESAAARASVAACAACRALHDDLVALAEALPAVPTPARPRAFTLTPADAARLRRTGWRGLLGRIGTARDTVTRPLAVGLTTFGLVGMLLASVPGALVGGTASAPADGLRDATTQGAAASTEALEIDEPPLPASEDGGVFQGTDEGDGAGDAGGGAVAAAPAPEEIAVRDDATGLSALFVLAGAMTIAGLGLLALRWSTRRL